jgi:hypothetical protein
MTTEVLINKDVSKTDETLHETYYIKIQLSWLHKKSFSSEIFKQLTFSDSVQSHD